EYTAIHADVFTEHDHVRVIPHRPGERQIDGFDQRRFRHGSHPSTRHAGERRTWEVRHRGARTSSLAPVAPSSVTFRPRRQCAPDTPLPAVPPPPCPTLSGSRRRRAVARSAPPSNAAGPL